MKVLRLSGKGILELRLSAMFYVTRDDTRGMGNSNITVDHDIKVSTLLFTRKLLVFCWRHDKFGDYIFPILPVLLNFSFFLFKREWQGSLWNLVSK
jgi:hypothetical protein